MRIDDYRQADCSRFRIPPLDLTSISSQLEAYLVKAWQDGGDPTSAIDKLLNDKDIVGGLTANVGDNLRFQRGIHLLKSEAAKTEQIGEYNAALNDQLQSIDNTVGAEAAERDAALKQRQQEEEQRRQAYSATRAQLERMRARVRDQLEKVGGKKKFDTLMTINDALTSNTAAPTELTPSTEQYGSFPERQEHTAPAVETLAPATLPKPATPALDRAIAIATSDETIDPLTNPDYDPGKPRPEPSTMNRLWRFLNKPLW